MNYAKRKGEKNITGARGEKYAARWLRFRGYRIVGRNVVMKRGEIDIIARRGGSLVFVEVKTRKDGENVAVYGRPALSVNREKRTHLSAAAQEYLRENPTKLRPRIDVIEVYLDPDNPRRRRIVQLKSAVIKP